MLNTICLVGRLVADPEGKYTSSGTAIAKMRLAVQRDFKNAEGEYEADFFDVTAWRKTAEFVTQYITKGRIVSVTGRLQSRKWVDDNGAKRVSFEIQAEHVSPIGPAPDGEKPAAAASTAKAAAGKDTSDLDEVDPFADE